MEPHRNDDTGIGGHAHSDRPWWRTASGMVLCGFLLVAGFFLLTQHTAHVFGALPFLLILACPLLHMFHHHGHGGHTGPGPETGGPVTGGAASQRPGDRP